MHDDDNGPERREAGTSYALVRDDSQYGATVFAFGDFDFFTSPALEEALLEAAAGCAQLSVDMSECRYLDAAAISVFIRVKKRLGERFSIVAPRGSATYRLLRLCELTDPLALHATTPAVDAPRTGRAALDPGLAAAGE